MSVPTREALGVKVQPVPVADEAGLRTAISRAATAMNELNTLEGSLDDLHRQAEVARLIADKDKVTALHAQYEHESATRNRKIDELKKSEQQVVVIIQLLPAK